jgi:magnesium transporter
MSQREPHREPSSSTALSATDAPVRERDVPPSVTDVIVPEASIQTGPTASDPGAPAMLVFGADDAPRSGELGEAAERGHDPDSLVWIDLNNYREDMLAEVSEALALPPPAIRGTLAGWRRPRVDLYEDQFFVAVTVPAADVRARVVQARELDCFIGQSFVVTAHKSPLPFTDRITERAQQNVDLLRGDAAYMLFIIIDELLNAYDRLTEIIEDEIELMEERALVETSDRLLADLLHLKRFVFGVHRLAEQHREVLAGFLRPDFPWVSGVEVEPYFRDLQSHHSDLLTNLSAARTGVNDAFDIYVSHVAHRTNYIVKLLTIVSVILLPMTAVFGLFGTNFQMEGMYQDRNFWVMLGAVLVLSSGLLVLFRVRRWL